MSSRTKIMYATAALSLIWTVIVAAGLCYVLTYERTPGSSGTVASTWPANSAITLATNRPTLVLFAHPRCPCSGATMSELATLMADLQGKVTTYVNFFEPTDADSDWKDTDLERTAAAIPGVQIRSDIDGVESRRFGAETSGHALLFSPDGTLLFSGGITASRGHAGTNAGENAIASIVNGYGTRLHGSLVFGCSIADAKRFARGDRP